MITKVISRLFNLAVNLFSFLIPVNNKLLLFGTHTGYYSDNSRFLMEYIKANRNYRVYWVGEGKEMDFGNGTFIKRGSFKANLYSLRASYIFFTHSYSDVSQYYNCRTVLVNLWHGSPTKKIGLDHTIFNNLRKSWLSKLLKRDFQKWHYFVISSTYWKSIFKSAYRFSDNQFICSGLPRIDYLTNSSINEQLKSRLCGDLNPDKILLYIPTYRQGVINSKSYDIVSGNIYSDLLLDKKLLDILEKNNYILLVKMHPLEGSNILINNSRIKILKDYRGLVEDLYLISDLMITDYSSAIFDFSTLFKPISLYIPDYKEMINSMGGFYFDYESCKEFEGFNISKSKRELFAFIENNEMTVDDDFYHEFNTKYITNNASKNICKTLNI